MVAADAQNVLVRWRRALPLTGDRCEDYTIVVPLFGDPSYFRNREQLEPYKEKVLVAAALEPEACAQLESGGWRVRSCQPEVVSPSALTHEALADVSTEYVIRLDGDSWPADDPGFAIGAAAAAGADLCSVKVLAARQTTAAECLQGVEYACAMRGRHLRPWETSGACIVGRKSALQAILARHTYWFVAEDIETGVLARHLRLRIAHLDLRVWTEVPSTFRRLFGQRRAWWAGNFRITWINFDRALHAPTSLAYAALLVWLGLVGKAATLVATAALLPAIILLYTGITLAANWEVRSRWMVLYPYCALVQALVLPAFGVARYVSLARANGTLGRLDVPRRRYVRWKYSA